MTKSVAIHNLGCKVNSWEATRMERALSAAGFRLCSFEEKADIYIVNTCTVTAIADKKSRQLLRRARELNPDALIVAAGCYVETGREALEKAGIADLFVGNREKDDIVRLILDAAADVPPDAAGTAPIAFPGHDRLSGRVRAFLKVQDGCSRFCSYCIIPHARGPVTERPPEEVLQEAEELLRAGFHELVVTGIHVSSLGEEKLAELLEKLDGLPGMVRLRLSSLEPTIVTPGFAERLSGLKSLCPHFHLSLQSGCDATLKRMNRHYTAAEYRRAAGLLRAHFDHPALTTDVIAGFPGETEEEFAESLRFCEEMRFFKIHIFPYSRRKGTMAAGMPDQVPNRIRRERCGRLKALEEKQELDYLYSLTEREAEVLLEEKKSLGGKEYYIGHTREYAPAAVAAEEGPALFPGMLLKRRPRGILEEKKTLLL